MKIALTLFNKEDKPMLVMDFDDYTDLRDYWKPRRRSMPKYKVQRVDDDELPAMRSACVGLTAKADEGWRLIGRDEYVLDGDQWWNSTTGKWMPTKCVDQKPAPTTTYRRRYAGDGYRFLVDGETIRSGDEYLVTDKWVPTALIGSVMGRIRNPDKDSELFYRRKLGKGNPPAGYRLLKADEKASEGDIYYSGKQWNPIASAGYTIGGGAGYFATPVIETNK